MDLTERLASGLLSLRGVEEGKSTFGPQTAFFVAGREFAHVHRDGEIDLRLTRPLIAGRRDGLEDDSRVSMRRNSDWVTVSFSSAGDVRLALELGRAAYDANRSARR
jgi:Family of unknown function (DUF5519)